MIAACWNQCDACDLLLTLGANIKATDNVRSMIHDHGDRNELLLFLHDAVILIYCAILAFYVLC
jgi:hypothetical protein